MISLTEILRFNRVHWILNQKSKTADGETRWRTWWSEKEGSLRRGEKWETILGQRCWSRGGGRLSFEAWHYCLGGEFMAVNGGDYGGTGGRSRQYLFGHVD